MAATAAPRSLLRFVACGSVDDGKSTLIGRLLRQSNGLQAGREPGPTVDVAYRFFATARRKFIVADTPGHEQYTRNMAAGASTAQLAVILIDARKGVLTQTRRHTRIAHLLGIRDLAVAVNKMDLAGWDAARFASIERDYARFARHLGMRSIQAIPISAMHGDNVVEPGASMPWYRGPPLLRVLEEVEVAPSPGTAFRMPVQWVNRPHGDLRGFCGRVAAGSVRAGDAVRVVPSGVETRVRSILLGEAALAEAEAGRSVTLTLENDVDIGRGDVICAAGAPVEAADQFEARLLWMHPHPLVAGRVYSAKLHTQEVGATATEIKYRLEVDSGARLAAKTVGMNDIAVVNLSFDRPVGFEPYDANRTLGGLILIDRQTRDTVGAGMIDFALRRAANIHWQALEVNADARAGLLRQAPRCIWFTGLPASGKSTIANLVDRRLHAAGRHTYLLDGDNVRHGLNRDLGFTEADRVENIRRVAEVARLMVDAGLIVLVSFISPFRAERDFARSLFRPGQFVEVHIDTPLEVCAARDPKGLYAKARSGLLKNFTGIDSPYERPENADIVVRTVETPAAEAAERIASRVLRDA